MPKLMALVILVLLATPCAHAQYSIDWYSVDGGGATSSGGPFSLSGTIGQPDAGAAAAGALQARCGFRAVGGCPADCDGNGLPEPSDVSCFVNRWFTSLQLGTLAGDFDGNGVVVPSDVSAFVTAWFVALTGGGC